MKWEVRQEEGESEVRRMGRIGCAVQRRRGVGVQ